MNKEQVAYVFGMVGRLEWFVAQSKDIAEQRPTSNKKYSEQLAQYEKVVRSMKRAATKLQFAVAAKNEEDSLHAMRTAYGLNQMVSAHVVSTFINLSNASSGGVKAPQVTPMELSFH